MEARAQRIARILGAVEDLVAQERASLETRDFAALTGVQNRLAPLVEELASQPQVIQEELLRDRIRAVHALRRETSERLAAELKRIETGLRETDDARKRAAKVAPAYRIPTAPTTRLVVVG